MLKSLITYLNLKLDLLNYFDLTRCLVELKDNSEGTRQPVEYISNGNYDVIDWDEFNGVSYWRLRDEITSDRTEEKKYKAGARNNIETTIPLKLVFAVPRTKLTEDDAYSFDRIRQTMVKQFAIDDDVIKTTLQAESVRINVVSANSDAKEVWEEETESTGTFEPKYETVFGSIDVDVVIISKHSCLPTECDDVESDIIRAFDWCGNTAVTVGRLTEAQQTCISDFICSCADATVQINGVEVATPASGATVDIPVNLDGVPSGSWDGDSWEVTSNPCADATVQLNGIDMADIASGDTENILVLQSNDMTQVGSKQGTHWRIDDSAISINGSPVADVRAEDSLDIDVTQDGSPVGSWNGSEFVIPSCPASASLAVSLSDTTPKLDETITITATPTDFTPTSYTFFLPKQDGTFDEVTQAGNTYNWKVKKYDAFEVTVYATDGSLEATSTASGTTSGDVDADAFITAHNAATGGTMDATMQANTLGFFLRLKGINTTYNEDVFAQLLAANAELYPMIPDSVSGASVAGYSINAIDPTRNATMVGFIPADATLTGLTGGSGKYMIMNNASSDYGQNDVAVDAYVRGTAVGVPIGAGLGPGDTPQIGTQIFTGLSSDRMYGKANSGSYVTPIGRTYNTGFLTVQRNTDEYIDTGHNGDVFYIEWIGSSAPRSELFFGMALNNAGTPTRNLTSSVSCLINRAYLHERAYKTLSEAVIWLQTQIGRNV